MPEDVDTLETKRSKLLEEFLSLGDLRPGLPDCDHSPRGVVFLHELKSQWHRFEAGRAE
jgi:hypothetical protein